MPNFPDLYVLRHGQTEWNLVKRYQGSLDSPLTALGREQAASQQRILAGLGEGASTANAFASPQKRAHDTARIALGGIGPEAAADDRLKEIMFGAWEGKTRVEIEALEPEVARIGTSKAWYFMAPDGESYDDIAGRVADFLASLQRPSIVVTHGVTSIVLRGLWLGMSAEELLELPHEQGCVYHLSNGQEICLTDAPS